MNNIFNKFPIISLTQAVLREITIADAPAFYDYITNENIAKYLAEDEIPSSVTSAQDELRYWMNLFKYQSSVYWAIADKKSNKMIGTCGFNYWNKENNRLEISYDLSYKFWGRGIATQAVQAITDFALKKMQAQRIQATVATDNVRSIKLLKLCKYKNEGTLVNFFNLQETKKDAYMYAKTS